VGTKWRTGENMSMNANWYYIEGDETLGPTTLEDLARQIRRAGRSRLVWTEGMAEWTDAEAVPALSQLFRKASPRSAATSERSNAADPSPSRQATLLQRLRRELSEYLIISAYLYVCFGSLTFYKAAVLHSEGIAYAPFGFAIVKALILGKFVLLLHALKIGERKGGAGVLFVDILKKSVLFLVFLIALTVIEEIIAGYFHGRAIQETITELGGGTLQQAFAVSLLMLIILIPYFAFRVIAARLGEGVLWRLLTERTSTASP
jgi:GYF domain 2